MKPYHPDNLAESGTQMFNFPLVFMLRYQQKWNLPENSNNINFQNLRGISLIFHVAR